MSHAPNELSFLPDDYLESKARRRTNVFCASIFGVVVLAIGSAFSFTEHSIRSVEREHEQIEAKYSEAAARIVQVQKMQEKQRTMARQAELTASLLERVPRSFLLAEVTNCMPPNVSLLEMTMESKLRPGPQKNSFDQRKTEVDSAAGNAPIEVKAFDVVVRVTGLAATNLQVAQFLAKLNQSKLLDNVTLVISDEYTMADEKLRRFQIEANVNPDAQVQPSAQNPKTAVVELSSTK